MTISAVFPSVSGQVELMNIYVGNLPFSAGDNELRDLFAQHGDVQSAKVIMDRDTGSPKGFGFVEMPDAAGQAAIAKTTGGV